MKFIQKNHFQRSKTNHRQFAKIKVCLEILLSEDSYRPVETGLKVGYLRRSDDVLDTVDVF